MRLSNGANKAPLRKKIKYFLHHPLRSWYWWKEVRAGIRNTFRKNSVRMIIAACMAMLGILFIISIFFKNEGKFVVTVERSLAEEGIVLSRDDTFTDLRYKLFSEAVEDCNNISINDLPLNLDEGEGAHNGDDYIAYSFYIRNEGSKTVGYAYTLNLGAVTKNLDEACWIMLYRNGVPTIYARQRKDGTPERQYSYEDFPIVNENPGLQERCRILSKENPGYLDEKEAKRLGVYTVNGIRELYTVPFESEKVVLEGARDNIAPGQSDKYTVVIWLEGEDPECVDSVKGGVVEYNMIFNMIDEDETKTTEKNK